MNYRGFGRSLGNPSVEGIISDGKAVLEYFQTQGKFNQSLPAYLIGYSLGTFVALTQMNSHFQGIILISPFTNTKEMLNYLKKEEVPFYARPFVKIKVDSNLYQLDNLKLIKGIQQPVLLLHGTRDVLIPSWMSQKLFQAAASQNKNLKFIEEADHNSIMSNVQFMEQVVKEISRFLAEP
ncbi:MAG: hypothetical protein Kow0042_17030 [Calditrichia bacterium]